MTQILMDGQVQTYRYWLVYYYGAGEQRVGAESVVRGTPLDNEEAIIEETERLEKIFGRPVVLDDWKRID